MKTHISCSLWSRILIVLAGIGVLVGVIDPKKDSVMPWLVLASAL